MCGFQTRTRRNRLPKTATSSGVADSGAIKTRIMLMQLISQNKEAILTKWFDLVIETYPSDGRRFFSREKDRFNNPVGYTISLAIEALLDELIGEMNSEKISSSLDDIIKIRAVQDFSPSDAIGFIFNLKNALRQELGEQIGENEALDELLGFFSKIDKVALMAFNKYMECREKVYDIKANELRNRSLVMIERINKKYGSAD